MLTQLDTVKARLALGVTDYDLLLTSAINAVSARFENECNRTFSRAVDVTEEFDAEDLEIRPARYPIEAVTKFELKPDETTGWSEQASVQYLIRRQCVISLQQPLDTQPSILGPSLARVTYTGGYLLPGSADVLSATRLPDDLEQAAIEQVAFWYRNRDKAGLVRSWPHLGTYESFAPLDLLLEVKAVLRKYERWSG